MALKQKPARPAGTESDKAGSAVARPEVKHKISGQLKFFSILFFVILVFSITFIVVSGGAERADTARIQLVHQLSVSASQLGKSSSLALAGNEAGFAELKQAYEEFTTLLKTVSKGGKFAGVTIRSPGGTVSPRVEALEKEWKLADDRIKAFQANRGIYVALGKFLNEGAGKLNWGGVIGDRLMRIAGQLTSSAQIDDATAQSLVKELRTQLDVAANKNDPGEFAGSARALQAALPDDLSAFAESRKGVVAFVRNTAPLTLATEQLLATLEAATDKKAIDTALVAFFIAMLLTLLAVIVKIFNEEAAERNHESETLRERAESDQKNSQEAILRLMNEMGDLADGDLTIRATVTEDVTGAIADSVNYTIEELAVLVRRINDAAVRVTAASASAQHTSDELLAATEVQTQEIRSANNSVLSMAESMTNVSVNALESARVARVSLAAAQKGSAAVTNSIKGMNEIRGQIQETSKRIKRLGESSQEIGEIVELISDITEQTNVLALNAAIQAASAGEAGRGFSVVAEEVQRLAERSGEATKQIAAIVKTIQTDTHDAVAAMENSTRGVVEGALLSDAAGQALEEISTVSQNLAKLIEGISGDTEKQASVATQVAKLMQNIQLVAEQTASGTRQTAVSIGELAELATELKGSVAGFKV